MTRRRVSRSGYAWPEVTAIHPEHGSYRFSVHGLRAPGGAITLMAFHGGPAADKAKMCDIVFSTAAGTRSDVIALSEEDISGDLAVFLAAKAHASPDTGVLVVPGSEWGIR